MVWLELEVVESTHRDDDDERPFIVHLCYRGNTSSKKRMWEEQGHCDNLGLHLEPSYTNIHYIEFENTLNPKIYPNTPRDKFQSKISNPKAHQQPVVPILKSHNILSFFLTNRIQALTKDLQ